MEHLVGLTWDHPRGRAALEAATERAAANGLSLVWHAQSLEGFEAAPIDALAERYDLIVLDHPHLGDAITSGCLQPMEDVVGEAAIADVQRRAVGPSLESYRLEGKTWALPLDAATQVSARRPDLLSEETTTWDDVVDLSRERRVALSLSGPHAYLTFASVCQSLGGALATTESPTIVEPSIGEEALRILSEISRRAPEDSATQNPIMLLERMSSSDDIEFIPLVFGYVGYARRDREHPVVFGASPLGPDGLSGSTIGGTGIAVTARATVSDALREHLLWLMADETQSGFIPQHEGQSSVAAAWESADVNAPVGDFYARTRTTIEAAWVRPRFAGFTTVQSRMAAVIRDSVGASGRTSTPLEELTRIQNEAARASASSTRRMSQGGRP